MSKQLTNEQIKYLFDFVQERGVKYIDVQHELVDHLASAIEEEMLQHPDWTYERCLQLVYGRFPITGFVHFVQEKEKAMKQYWRRLQWTYLKSYFTLPKVLITLSALLLTWSVFFWSPAWISGLLYGFSFFASLWMIAETSQDTYSGRRSFLYWEPLFVLGLGVLVVIPNIWEDNSWGLQWYGWIAIIQGLIMIIQRHRAKHSFESRQSALVLESFYRNFFTLFPLLLYLPIAVSDGHIIASCRYSIQLSSVLAAICTVAWMYNHMIIYYLRPLIMQELKQKHPHLNIA